MRRCELASLRENPYLKDANPSATAWLALVCVSAGNFLTAMSNSGITLSLPAIAAEYPATAVQLSWVPTIFVLTNAILILPFGRLADRVGLKRVYITGMVLFSLACAAAAVAPDFNWIIALRALQACGAAMLQACGMAIVMQLFPQNRRGTAIGIGASCLYLGLSVGPPLGGFITDTLGWRATFMVPLPFSVIVIGLIVLFLRQEWRNDEPINFDVVGFALLAASLILLMMGVSALPAHEGALMAFGGLALAIAFIYTQMTFKNPLLRLKAIVGNRVFSRSALFQMNMYAAAYSVMYLVSLYLQYIKGLSASMAGTAMLVQATLMAIVAPLAGRIADSTSPRLISTCGSAAAALGYLGLVSVGFETPLVLVYGCLALVGIGMGMFTSPNYKLALGAVPSDRLATGTAVINSARNVGNIIGMSVVLMLVALRLSGEQIAPANYDDFLSAVRGAFVFSFGSALMAALLGLKELRRSQQPSG